MIWAILAALAPTLLVLLSMSALISAAETSMTAASRGRMHQLERDGDPAARRVNRLIGNQETMIGAILLANNVMNIFASVVTTQVLGAAFPGWLGAAIATAVMTVLVVIFAEIMPKTIAIARADDTARTLSIPTYWLVKIFGPLADGAQWVVRRTLKPFGIKLDAGTDVLAAHEEIRGAVEYHHSEGLVETRDRWMLGGVLDLAEMDVGEVMVHRRSIVMIDGDMAPREILAEALDSGHTRIPIYREEPENVVGVLHVKDLLQAIAKADGDIDRIDVPSILRAPWFIPETTSLKDQLAAFLKRQNHFALVVDEYGALEGLVTLEDILEEIVGEIEDEHDVVAPGVTPQADGWVSVEGSVTIRDLNRALNWQLPDDEAVTVAGLLINESQRIPEVGETFAFHRHRFRVAERRGNQLTLLTISPPEPDESLD
ncbi:HlyC/CorC family transporter [Phenylobacterium sp. J426]|uniref:HlyC/CorC family transporter n=1 Tax=Phenylobacterium sp. J426 TaxID=2898439 RepID=UPI002151FBFA|nr:HlyC/CorC family transporter [Phenylobacterium sp. J426]MCR5874699.1 HlyC/CorC family transporter [Phenylobacterium sp. J426]